MALLLLRHGEATANAQGLLLGRTDVELTERGEQQARALGDMVGDVNRLISSPLRRARDTALALGLDRPIEIDERWIEVDYGEHEGRPLSDVPAEIWRRWRSDITYRPAGGESLADVAERVERGLRGAVRDRRRGRARSGGRRRRGEPRLTDQGRGGVGSRARPERRVATAPADRFTHPGGLGALRHGAVHLRRGSPWPLIVQRRGVAPMKSTMTWASTSPLSSWRKWPPPSMVVWGWPLVPGTWARNSASAPRVIASWSL